MRNVPRDGIFNQFSDRAAKAKSEATHSCTGLLILLISLGIACGAHALQIGSTDVRITARRFDW